MVGIKYKSGTIGHFTDLPPIGFIPDIHGRYMFPLHCVTSDQTLWSRDFCKACESPPPPHTGVVPPGSTFMGEIICYWVQQSPEVGAPVGCQEQDTNLTTGVVTTSVPITPPTLYAGWILIVSTTLGWSGGPSGTGQVDFPDVQYTGTGDPTVDTAAINQMMDQVLANLATASGVP